MNLSKKLQVRAVTDLANMAGFNNVTVPIRKDAILRPTLLSVKSVRNYAAIHVSTLSEKSNMLMI